MAPRPWQEKDSEISFWIPVRPKGYYDPSQKMLEISRAPGKEPASYLNAGRYAARCREQVGKHTPTDLD